MERWMERSRKRGREGEEGRKGGGKDIVRKMHVFTDDGHHLMGLVRKMGGFTDREISESQNPAIPESNNLGSNNPESGNPINLSDSVFLKDLYYWFSDRFSPEGVAVVGRMDAVD